MPPDVSLRPMVAQDLPFLHRVYASTRADILMLPWDESQKQALIEMQFRAQHSYYLQQFPAADYLVVERGGQPVGRLYVDRRPEKLHILDITLLPEARGAGIGTALLQDLMAEAGGSGKAVSLFVERENTARKLYESLSFQPVTANGVYMLMEWRPVT